MKYRVYFTVTRHYYRDMDAQTPEAAIAKMRHEEIGDILDGYTYFAGDVYSGNFVAEPIKEEE